MPLHHVVMFKLAGGDGGASATAIDPLIRTLAQTAPGTLTCETAVDAGVRPGHPRSYHRLVHFTFADVDGFRAYLDSPEHLEFLAGVADIVESIAAVQYDSVELQAAEPAA